MTRDGVEYSLIKSPFIEFYGGIRFYFSSRNHHLRFVEGVEETINSINTSLSNRFKFDIELKQLGAIWYYIKVESRGFLIYFEGRFYSCPESLKLIGERLTPNA